MLVGERGIVKIIDFDISERFSWYEPELPVRTKNSSPIIQAPECLQEALGLPQPHEQNAKREGKLAKGPSPGESGDFLIEGSASSTTSIASSSSPVVKGELLDVWGFGITLYYCAYGTYPFYSDVSVFELFKRIINQPVVFPHAPWFSSASEAGQLEDLLRGCLEKDPKKRITTSEIRHHPWFRGVGANLENECRNLSQMIPKPSNWELMTSLDDYLGNKTRTRYRKVAQVYKRS